MNNLRNIRIPKNWRLNGCVNTTTKTTTGDTLNKPFLVSLGVMCVSLCLSRYTVIPNISHSNPWTIQSNFMQSINWWTMSMACQPYQVSLPTHGASSIAFKPVTLKIQTQIIRMSLLWKSVKTIFFLIICAIFKTLWLWLVVFHPSVEMQTYANIMGI